MKKSLSILFMIFTLATSGCNLLIKLPFGGPKLIPTETFLLDEAAPASASITAAILTLAPSNGNLNLAGEAKGLGEGTIQYNISDWKPTLAVEGATLRIEQIMPDGSVSSTPKDSLNQWDLKLGNMLSHISVSCPAGNYTLNFAGTLPDGASISVNAGVGNVRLVFPAGVSVYVEVHRGPANITTEGAWTTNGKIYTSGNSDLVWTVIVDIGVGKLTLVTE
ncbi:MAG TPA: toast rack family protein [Anaerolineales bacterium]|nr:toast rack family protein [Anaerolineales bacterium]